MKKPARKIFVRRGAGLESTRRRLRGAIKGCRAFESPRFLAFVVECDRIAAIKWKQEDVLWARVIHTMECLGAFVEAIADDMDARDMLPPMV